MYVAYDSKDEVFNALDSEVEKIKSITVRYVGEE